MKRRNFLAAAGLAGLAPLADLTSARAAGGALSKEFYQLMRYELASQAKQKALLDFLGRAAIPALSRIGIGPVGVFVMLEGDSPDVYVLVPHKSLESAVTVFHRLGNDGEFFRAGAEFLEAPKSDPAYKRMEISLMLAFDAIPKVEIPSRKKSRIFELRVYESHSIDRAQKKIEMFNSGGELDIFRRVGMPPVFFGETLAGPKMPNLTYMLGFDDMEALKTGWDKFLGDPAWDRLKKDPAYADTVSNITKTLLRPARCSQI